MVLIFGFGPGEAKDLGEVAPVVCPNCHNEVFLHRIQSKKTVRLYFVPVVPYGTDEYLLCPICHQGLQLSSTQMTAVERMQGSTKLVRQGRLPQDFYRTQVEAFWHELGVAPSGAQVVRPASTIPPPAISPVVPGSPAAPPQAIVAPGTGDPSIADRLAGLADLHRDGVLTDDEFTAAKRRLLER